MMTNVWAAAVVAGAMLAVTASQALGHGHGGHGHGGHGLISQAIKDANYWRDGFRGPHDFGGGVKIPHDAGLNKGLGGGLDGRGFGRAATPLDGGGRRHQANPTLPGPSEGLREYLRSKRDGVLGFFPGFITADNFEEMFDRYFVAIGVVERLHVSLQTIANALGRSVDGVELPRLNVNAEPVEEVHDLRAEFMANHPLDYQMHRYACERASPSDAPRRNGPASS